MQRISLLIWSQITKVSRFKIQRRDAVSSRPLAPAGPVHCHYHRGIHAICSQLDNQFVRSFEHVALTLSPRVSHGATLSIFVGNFTGRPPVSYRRRRDTAKCRRTRHKRARTCKFAHDGAQNKKVIYARHPSPLSLSLSRQPPSATGQVPRRVKRVRVKYDGVSGRVIFFVLSSPP